MFAKILIPIDGSDLSLQAVRYAAQLVGDAPTQTIVLHVRPEEPAAVMGEGIIMDMTDLADFDANTESESEGFLAAARHVMGQENAIYRSERAEVPWRTIIEVAEAEKCDVIVMSSHGRRGVISRLLGSETQKVLSHTKIPVLSGDRSPKSRGMAGRYRSIIAARLHLLAISRWTSPHPIR